METNYSEDDDQATPRATPRQKGRELPTIEVDDKQVLDDVPVKLGELSLERSDIASLSVCTDLTSSNSKIRPAGSTNGHPHRYRGQMATRGQHKTRHSPTMRQVRNSHQPAMTGRIPPSRQAQMERQTHLGSHMTTRGRWAKADNLVTTRQQKAMDARATQEAEDLTYMSRQEDDAEAKVFVSLQ